MSAVCEVPRSEEDSQPRAGLADDLFVDVEGAPDQVGLGGPVELVIGQQVALLVVMRHQLPAAFP